MEIKKYSEMTFEEFLTDVLQIKLNEQQTHMVKMFEETKIRKVEYINNDFSPKYTREEFEGITKLPKMTYENSTF